MRLPAPVTIAVLSALMVGAPALSGAAKQSKEAHAREPPTDRTPGTEPRRAAEADRSAPIAAGRTLEPGPLRAFANANRARRYLVPRGTPDTAPGDGPIILDGAPASAG